MCGPTGTVFDVLAGMAPPSAPALPEAASPPVRGSRRRRIWELDRRTHCPLVGVCVPVPALKRIALRIHGAGCFIDDYALHCQAVADCSMRTPMAEALQREIDRSFAMEVRQASRIKDPRLLEAWWRAQSAGPGLAGALWAVLTHPHASLQLTGLALGEVHMLQHQLGAAERADHRRLRRTLEENAALSGALHKSRERSAELVEHHTRVAEQLRQENSALRARVAILETAQASAQDDRRLRDQLNRLQRELALTREQLHRLQRRRKTAAAGAPGRPGRIEPSMSDNPAATAAANGSRAIGPAPSDGLPQCPLPPLTERAVLCVGGRPANVPAYRRLVEDQGGRFLHHDGGAEESQARLDSTLAAADLVLCQTGCISHDAYWRVKEHCKRTGKPCLFVESPSRTGLARALSKLSVPERAENGA